MVNKIDKIPCGIADGLPSVATAKISYTEQVAFLTYKINECVDLLNKVAPEIYIKRLDEIDSELDEKLDKSAVDNALSDTSENPVQNKIVKSAIDKKLTMRTDGASMARLYAITTEGQQTQYRATDTATYNTIPIRNTKNNFSVGTPTTASECANKNYVDNAVSGIVTKSTKVFYSNQEGTYNFTGVSKSDLEKCIIFVNGYYQYTDAELSSFSAMLFGKDYILPSEGLTISPVASPIEIPINNSGETGNAVISREISDGSITVTADKNGSLTGVVTVQNVFIIFFYD